MILKGYQRAALTALGRFLSRTSEVGAAEAFAWTLKQPESEEPSAPALSLRLGRYAKANYRPLNDGLAEIPYACLRLPTGGGKTLLAAETVQVARDAGIAGDYPLVLWLVTSRTIRAQTADALANPAHPFRASLDKAFDGRVEVFDIADFARIRPDQLASRACLVVGTIQALRVGDTEGRRAYAHNENLEPHFTRLPPQALAAPGLERDGAGQVKFSFANLLHLRRPLMIVDEAHNAVTGLSREIQARVNPCAVVEFTATPRGVSNVLFNASAAELKAEEMLKLPIELEEHSSWQSAVAKAVQTRARLAVEAAGERDYIRPLALYQAEPKNREVTVEVLRRHLIETENVPESRVVVATGEERGLEGLNLADPSCPVEHIITVEALREGWDAPFAYVFCSVASIRSATAVEQLLGRVLRMPYAARRKSPRLNRAYAHVSEPTFAAAAEALRDKLVAMGFDAEEAEEAITEPAPTLPLFLSAQDAPAVDFDLPDSPPLREVLARAGIEVTALDHARVAPDAGALSRLAGAPAEEREAFLQDMAAAVAEAERPVVRAAIARYIERARAELPPALRGEAFGVPRLMVRIQGELEFADVESVWEHVDWRLADESPLVPDLEASLAESVRRFEIDVRGAAVIKTYLNNELPGLVSGGVEGWTVEHLVAWLDRQTREVDLLQSDLQGWLHQVVRTLLNAGHSVEQLMRLKYVLARRLKDRIAELRAARRQAAVQAFLFDPGARVEANGAHTFDFRLGMFEDERLYRGGHRFQKHFLGPDLVPAFDGNVGGEEERCAWVLDSLADVAFWVRNVARHSNAFWLPTVTGRFYPDFVAKLTDGRIFVVEYKGEQGWADAEIDRIAGAAWERARGGLFLMVRRLADGLDPLGQMKKSWGAEAVWGSLRKPVKIISHKNNTI